MQVFTCRPLAIVAMLCVSMASFRAAEPRTGAFAVGVMRRDGVLVPFAAFDGKRWAVMWSAPQIELQLPINVTSIPKAWWASIAPQETWQLWPGLGGPPSTVRVTQTDWVQAHCQRQVALRTDYRSARPEVPSDTQPYPKDGLVVAPPQAVEPIESLPSDSEEAAALATALTDAFNRAERETAQSFRHPLKQEPREKIAVTTEAVYAFGREPRVYYVEAARNYEPSGDRDAECTMAFGTGWFTKDASGAIKKLDMAVDLLPCNRFGATYMLPLGVLRLDGRVYWLAQYAGWNHERYMVIEAKKNNVEAIVGAWGGGCR